MLTFSVLFPGELGVPFNDQVMLEKVCFYPHARPTLAIHWALTGSRVLSKGGSQIFLQMQWVSLCKHHRIRHLVYLPWLTLTHICFLREFQATLEFRPIRDTDGVEDHQITVCVRKRPLNKKELARKEVDVITVPSKDRIIVHEPKTKV